MSSFGGTPPAIIETPDDQELTKHGDHIVSLVQSLLQERQALLADNARLNADLQRAVKLGHVNLDRIDRLIQEHTEPMRKEMTAVHASRVPRWAPGLDYGTTD